MSSFYDKTQPNSLKLNTFSIADCLLFYQLLINIITYDTEAEEFKGDNILYHGSVRRAAHDTK